ncbi:hypothetical protein AAC387_Pa02g2475 [Persea americana]
MFYVPISLFCTLLLCLHLAFFFSSTTTNTYLPSLCSPISKTNTNTTTTTKYPSSKPKTPPPQGAKYEEEEVVEEDDDEEEDDALFRLASLTNPNPTTPKKIAFMFLTTTPLPLSPLWELFFQTPKPPNQTQPLFNIYIHADPSRPYDPPFSGVFSGRVIPSKPTRRADPSLISAARRLLARALLHDPSNAMFVLLSPSCIPIRSFPFIYETLANCSTKSFIEILSNETTLRVRYDARGSGTMLPEVRFDSFRVGSQFFALSRRHARLVVTDTRLWPKFKLPCKSVYTCYPEEHYFSTLLGMEMEVGDDTCVPATLTHVDWSWRGSKYGHPRTYKPEQVGPGLIRGLRRARPRYGDAGAGNWSSSEEYPFLFARKFSPMCLEPLMRIASDVIFRD